MPRRARIDENIFLCDADLSLFLDTIGECSERFEIEFFSYVLMSNHYHLLLRTRRANLSRAMHWFAGTYTGRFNNRHGRRGHLFQGRFKSFLVENDAYILQLSCYIHFRVAGGYLNQDAVAPAGRGRPRRSIMWLEPE